MCVCALLLVLAVSIATHPFLSFFFFLVLVASEPKTNMVASASENGRQRHSCYSTVQKS